MSETLHIPQQSRKADAGEALANSTIGLIVSILLTWLWLGFTPIASIGITAVFFTVSTLRAYILRRVFRGIANG